MGLLLPALAGLTLARAVDLPVATIPPDARCHASVDEAAVEALKVAMALSADVEHGGAIYERHGCFVFSSAVTNNRPLAVLFKVRMDGSTRLTGIYHTHTLASGRGDQFSVEDVMQARSSRVPSFVGVHGSNLIRRLDVPGRMGAPLSYSERMVLRYSTVRGVVLAVLPRPAPLASS